MMKLFAGYGIERKDRKGTEHHVPDLLSQMEG